VTTDPLLPVGGRLAVRRVALDPELVERYTAPPERVSWWRARTVEAWTHLERPS
jgi:o-succinylbenzoate synthase